MFEFADRVLKEVKEGIVLGPDAQVANIKWHSLKIRAWAASSPECRFPVL
jgi:hypothetical protein